MAKYKIEITDNKITLYRRRLRLLWFVKDSKKYKYFQQAINIQRKWLNEYGVGNFVKE